jgi:hypothetical protein
MLPKELFEILYRNCILADIGLVLIGDFLQLPPVPEFDGGPFPGWAFQSEYWNEFTDNGKNIIRLTKNHRAGKEPAFCEFLSLIRADNGAGAERIFQETGIHWDRRKGQVDEFFPGTTVILKKIPAREINAEVGKTVAGPAYRYAKEKSGKQNKKWNEMPDVLTLKVGHRVRVLQNKRGGGGDFTGYLYVNGMTGVVQSLGPEGVDILTDRGKRIVVGWHTEDNAKWSLVRKYNGDGYVRVKGTPTARAKYIPLDLSYCSTVHKAQGLTLDRVQIPMHMLFTKYPGGYPIPCLLYVALSRARRGQDVYLTGEASIAEACCIDPALKEWI